MAEASDYLHKVRTRATLHLPAEYLAPARLREGIQRKLNERLLRYVEDLSGVILSYDSIALAQSLGRLHNEVPYVHFDVIFDAVVFSPKEGMHVVGVVNSIGRDYVGMLVLGVFNASVPMAEVPAGLQSKIAVGTRLEIELTGVHVAHDRLSLSGSLLAPGTRIITGKQVADAPKKHKRKESNGAMNDVGASSEHAFVKGDEEANGENGDADKMHQASKKARKEKEQKHEKKEKKSKRHSKGSGGE